MKLKPTVVLALLAASAVTPLVADDWPQFRGPQRDGISGETGVLRSWPEGGPRVVWDVPLGSGYSAISVYKGRLFTMFGRDGDEIAAAFDAATGAELWHRRIDAEWKDRMGDGPRATPTVDDGIVYVLSARGQLAALNAGDGAPVWSRDLVADFGAKPPRWGMAASPLVEEDLLLVAAGGSAASLVALNKKTGKTVWTSFEDKAGYAAPLALTVGAQRLVVFFTASHLVAVAPRSGQLLWRDTWKTSYDVNAAIPVFVAPDRVFVSSGYDVGGAMLRILARDDGVEVETLWKNREMKNQFSSSVHHDGYLYGFDDGTLKCVDVTTGERRWRERGFGHGSLIFVDGHLFVLGDEGTLALVRATPEGHDERARTALFRGKSWTAPAFAGGRLYARDEKRMVALDVSTND